MNPETRILQLEAQVEFLRRQADVPPNMMAVLETATKPEVTCFSCLYHIVFVAPLSFKHLRIMQELNAQPVNGKLNIQVSVEDAHEVKARLESLGFRVTGELPEPI